MGSPGLGRVRAIEPSSRLGVLGGTFDPIHNGHLAIAAAVQATLGLDAILFIPAGVPPHKSGRQISPGSDRRAMVELAITGRPPWSSSSIELDRPGPSYSVDTLAELSRPGDEGQALELILSTEALAGLPEWHEPLRILELARLAVVPRAGAGLLDTARLDRELGAWRDRVDFVDAPPVAISASGIRERIRSGRSIEGLVPDAVAAYIEDHRLYTDPS